jgi:hypothetical protein
MRATLAALRSRSPVSIAGRSIAVGFEHAAATARAISFMTSYLRSIPVAGG